LEAALRQNFPDIQIELVGGHKGIFDVFVDDRLLFSKHKEGRFPANEEILDLIRAGNGS